MSGYSRLPLRSFGDSYTSELREDGWWTPATPEPFWIGPGLFGARCKCGRRFWWNARARYGEHFHFEHQLAVTFQRPLDDPDAGRRGD